MNPPRQILQKNTHLKVFPIHKKHSKKTCIQLSQAHLGPPPLKTRKNIEQIANRLLDSSTNFQIVGSSLEAIEIILAGQGFHDFCGAKVEEFSTTKHIWEQILGDIIFAKCNLDLKCWGDTGTYLTAHLLS